MKNNIFAAKTIEELKKCGKLTEIRPELKGKAAELGIKVKVNSWANTMESIKGIQGLAARLMALTESSSVESDPGYNDLFFKSESAKYIFFLTRLDGEARFNALGLTNRHFKKQDLAKEWRNTLLSIVHPDNCNHPDAAAATAVVNEIYEEMIKR